ncbi:DUF1176 domain-containing protein [Aureimonas flava]|uniref:DUF1176 domain-containing protein n=1 Tax=Aureimonas flava TaxID=2320271 RepID=A0A3A1WQ01_9HYPH|nr:DUF1176 domain-containing protein [Aureimonas flava]RIY02072.1 DUF1176 domain-containing protein [Aureimonas flava]
MRPSLLACVGLLAAATSAHAQTGGSFRDWALSCTPGLRCDAQTFAAASEGITAFGLERDAAADAPLRLTLWVVGEARPAGDVVFRVDGTEALSLPASAFAATTGDEVAASAEGVRTALLPKLRDGEAVEVSTRIGDRAVSQRFSLSGLVAALRKMDDDQGRIGTRTALTDRGDKPLPDRAALPADVATADDLPAPVRALWQGAGGCAERDEDGTYGNLGFSVPFGADTRLFVLACGMPGAYNYPSRLYSYTAGENLADAVPLATMTADGPTADLTVWNVDFSGDHLWSLMKGRGLGDCGRTATWRIDAQAGALVLVEAREKQDCDGEGDPESWPLLWPKA